MDREEKETMTSSRETILSLVADGVIKEDDIKLNEEEKKLVENYKKTNEIIKEKKIEMYWSVPID